MSRNSRNRGPVRQASAVGSLPHPRHGLDDESNLMTTDLTKGYSPRNMNPTQPQLREGMMTAQESTQTTRDSPTIPNGATREWGANSDHDPETTGNDLTQRGPYSTPATQSYLRTVDRKR